MVQDVAVLNAFVRNIGHDKNKKGLGKDYLDI